MKKALLIMILATGVVSFSKVQAQNTYVHSMASSDADGKLSPVQSLHEVRRVYGFNDGVADYPVSVWRFPAAKTKAILDATIDVNFRNPDGSVLSEAQKAALVANSTTIPLPTNFTETFDIQRYDAQGNAKPFTRPLHPGEQGIAYNGTVYLLVLCLNGSIPKSIAPLQTPPAQDVWTPTGTPPATIGNSYSYSSPAAAGPTTNTNTAAPITITITNPAPAAPVVVEKKEGSGLLAGIVGFGAGILADRLLFNNNNQQQYYPQQAAYSGYGNQQVIQNQQIRQVYNPGNRGGGGRGNGGSTGTGGTYSNGWFVGPSNGNGTNQPIINNPAPYIPSGTVRRW